MMKHRLFSLVLLASCATSWAQKSGANLPILDVSAEKNRQIVIAQGTDDIYQGHPTTVLMPDGQTIYAAWSYNHGGKAGPLAKSTDGGKQWQMIPTPADWGTTFNCPSIYWLKDPAGKERLMVFAARPAMSQTWSEDGGKTWTPVRSLGKPCIMAFSSIIKLNNGDYLGLYHRGPDDKDKAPLKIWQSISKDGGVTWGESVMVCEMEGRSPCEPAVFRSPNGKELLCIMRENQRKNHSLMMVSTDEGQTWSVPTETPWGLTGDRHMIRYTSDGRIVSVFRDMAPNSPTKGHFVAWVGTYNDIKNGLSGQYRVKLLHSFAGPDCGYPGLELLSDGTFVATTYIKYQPGTKKHSVVAVRFKVEEFDKMF
ncbi:sialidase family protein [Runella zeae]|uniref:sialidase family protein n=1 Tax=Runella zeae TaxID=94255 RepID=UPI000419004E|nr:sialidase family protein [Runella zeae]